MRLRRPWRLALVPAVLITAGCFQGQRTIHLKADGSGTITDTLVLGEQMKAMMAMADAKGKDKGERAKEKAKNEAAALAMGPGVTFVSEDKTPSGIKTVYAFRDIGAVKVGASPGPDSTDKEAGTREQPLTFRFARQGGKSVVTVVQPQPARREKTQGATGGTPEPMASMGAAMWTMMKPMMKGLSITTVLEVDGPIVKSSSPYVSGSAVTLLELDFDKITADDANFQKFTRAGGDPSTLDPKLLQGVKGIKVSPAAEITVEFTGKQP